MILKEVPTQDVILGPNIRRDAGPMGELTNSVRELGVLNPITVREVADHQFEAVTGGRRLQAAKEAGLASIPAVVRTTEETRRIANRLREEIQQRDLRPVTNEVAWESQRLLEQLTENVQRQNLAPLDEGMALARYLAMTGESQTELARRLGKPRGYVNAMLVIVRKLSSEEQEALRRANKQPPRQTLIAAAKIRDPELRQAALRGQMSAHEAVGTVAREYRSRREHRPVGRPKNFVLRIVTAPATMTVTFRKPRVSQAEAVQALKLALANVAKRGHWPPKA